MVREHGDRVTADLDALVTLNPLEKQWDRVDRVGTVLATLARQRVDRPHAHRALRVTKKWNQRMKRFRVGEVVLRGVKLNEPCKHLEEVIGKPIIPSLIHRCGLFAEILEGGVIRPGDSVEELDSADSGARGPSRRDGTTNPHSLSADDSP